MSITLKQIAELAGVSAMTASRALRGSGRVDLETRRRLLEIAKREGYGRSSGATVLGPTPGAVDTQYLRLLYLHAGDDNVQGGYTQTIRKSLAASLSRSGGKLTSLACGTLEDILRVADDVRAQGVVLRTQLPTQWLDVLRRRMPVVYAVSFDHQLGVDSIYTNEHRSAALIYRRLLDLGHRDIAWFGIVDRHRPAPNQVFEAAESAEFLDRISSSIHGVRHAAWANLTIHQPTERQQPLLLLERDWHRQSLEDVCVLAADRLMALHPRPTAVVVSAGSVARVLAGELIRRGCRIPEDLSLATYGTVPPGKGPKLATIELPMEDIASAIPEMIRRRLAKPDAPPLSMQFETRFRPGASLAPPPPPPAAAGSEV